MKKLIHSILILCSIFLIISCGSTPKTESVSESISETEDETIVINEPVEIEEPVEITEDDEVMDVDDEVMELPAYVDEEEEEYIRSTNNLSTDEVVTKEEFADDKAEILRIIDELKDIMIREDVKAWMTYIAPDSIKYYSSPANIRKAQKKLPNKTIVLNGIGDYFKYVFIPSRKRSEVKEIRYISKTNIKAVDVKSDGSLIVYYQFVKVNNKWLVHIPTL